VPTKNVKMKVPTTMPNPVPPKIIPEPDFGQPHSKVHGGERKIDQPQLKHRGESVPLNGIIIFL
jgi:hypothetical protein